MNRETKRMLQRQGQLGPDGEPVAKRRERQAPQPKTKEQRTSPRQFLREVRAELRKVAWPTRSEVINYSIIVLVAVLVMMAFIAIVDYAASEFVLKLFDE